MSYLVFGVLGLLVYGFFRFLSHVERKSAARALELYKSITRRYYDMGRALRASGEPYAPLWQKPPKGSFTRALAPFLEEARRQGYAEAERTEGSRVAGGLTD